MIVQYHPLTASDLDSAISYYNQQRAGLGEEFRSEVYAAIERFVLIRFISRLSNTIFVAALCVGFHTGSCSASSITKRSEC